VKPAIIYYATKSAFKRAELDIIERDITVTVDVGIDVPIGDVCNFVISAVATNEPLEIDLEQMVRHKVQSAYRSLLMPCIVEHAGLILENDRAAGFPGGLTQPMWDALTAEGFLRRTGASGEKAIARAVIGFCDGMSVRTFVGETCGVIADCPRGNREFYWDTVFCPDGFSGLTYAEVAEGPGGLRSKVSASQSMKAIRQLASHIARNGNGQMFETA
jgi:XTP/dITP diphosphohydrolase